MLILSVETSCDETAVAVTRDGRQVLTDQIFSQTKLHAVYGGVVPEIASRAHVETVSLLADRAIEAAGITKKDIEAVAVSYAPGLIGALLVGVNFAKSAAFALGAPLIPVHHIKGHIAANYIAYPKLEPPFLCLCVSGGNTLLADVRGYTDVRVIGQTRDDAAGECFDKAARVMGLPYPGGPEVDGLSRQGDDKKYALPRAEIAGSPLDMSFSGLKTAVCNIAHNAKQKGETLDRPSLCASLCAAVSDALTLRCVLALDMLGYKKLAIAGGVAANSRIRRDFETLALAHDLELFIPPLKLCGDNAAMIGAQGFFEYQAGVTAGTELNALARDAL